MVKHSRSLLRKAIVASAAAVMTAAVAVAVVATSVAQAAAGCRVDYVITNQWPDGFGANVTITNLGDPINGWQLTWSFTAGQTVAQLWNGSFTQTGSQVSVVNASYNPTIPTGGTVTFGFNGTWNNVANPVPTDFALNGTACTGAVTTTTTRPPTTTTSRPPTTTTRPPTTTTPPNCATGAPPPSYPNPGLVTGSIGAHDPAVVRAPDGTYIMITTGPNLPIKKSTDRIHWWDAGVVWPNGAPWTLNYTSGSNVLWAPDISYHNGKYWLYYSASTFGSQKSAIFVATSPTAEPGSWVHGGTVIESTSGLDYNAIDPNLFVDASGDWWLTFGSFWSGIKMIRLDTLHGTGLWAPWDMTIRSLASRPTAGGAIEAPFIYYRCGYYYLFVSFDLCCRGAQSTYRIMVGRSTSITGPYVDRNGVPMTSGGATQVLASHGSIIGPGHQAVISDVDGDVLFYHYYTSSGASFLGINLLGWDSAGWPFVY